ncbi:MAG TPA: chemotaxis protein CheW [Vicinamibacterales bacterium]|nr:chemotaxis protein CheW [Vicinamibacterales bacterium]
MSATDEQIKRTDTQWQQALAGKYLTCALGQEEYALSVLQVREIIKMMSITAVPQVPPYVKGVINLRGKVIPVVDLRLKFGFAPQDHGDRTSIIVVEVAWRDRSIVMGLVVDAVADVLNIAESEIERMPDFGHRVQTDYLKGVAKVKGTVKILLDLDRILGGDDTMGELSGRAA